jgi:hypothetical protein
MTLDQFLKHGDTVGLLKAVATSPGDPLPRHMLADHAELHGFTNVAHGQRWAAKNGKYAAARVNGDTNGGWFVDHQHPMFRSRPGQQYHPHVIPAAFDRDPARTTGSVFTRSAHPDTGTLHNEHDFVRGSHHAEWDDAGELVDGWQHPDESV